MNVLREPLLYKTVRAERDGQTIEGTCTDETRHTITVAGKRLIKRHWAFEVEGTRFTGALIDRTPADRITIQRNTK